MLDSKPDPAPVGDSIIDNIIEIHLLVPCSFGSLPIKSKMLLYFGIADDLIVAGGVGNLQVNKIRGVGRGKQCNETNLAVVCPFNRCRYTEIRGTRIHGEYVVDERLNGCAVVGKT